MKRKIINGALSYAMMASALYVSPLSLHLNAYAEERVACIPQYTVGAYSANSVVYSQGRYFKAKYYAHANTPPDGLKHAWEVISKKEAIAARGEACSANAPTQEANVGVGVYSVAKAYQQNSFVFHDGFHYRARTWNQGAEPRPYLANPWDSPWERVSAKDVLQANPHLATSGAVVQGNHLNLPTYIHGLVYDAGEIVFHNGGYYRAKWNAHAKDPDAQVDNPWDTPWESVSAEEIARTNPGLNAATSGISSPGLDQAPASIASQP